MSLQGTLDTFALPEVLRLLSSKTGRLRIEGKRGNGDVWVSGGKVVAARADGATEGGPVVETLFELLRYSEGRFSFDGAAGDAPEAVVSGMPVEIGTALDEAGALLTEWRAIEAVVPSVRARVRLADRLDAPQVTIDAEQWRVVAAVGGGETVAAVGTALGLGELPACRVVKALVEAGLARVDGEAPEEAPPAARRSDGARPSARSERQERPERAGKPVSAPAPVPAAEDDEDPVAALVRASQQRSPELAAELAKLGPEGHKAVAAAAEACTAEEREAALAEIEEQVEGEPINRGVLLKFLSSVRS